MSRVGLAVSLLFVLACYSVADDKVPDAEARARKEKLIEQAKKVLAEENTQESLRNCRKTEVARLQTIGAACIDSLPAHPDLPFTLKASMEPRRVKVGDKLVCKTSCRGTVGENADRRYMLWRMSRFYAPLQQRDNGLFPPRFQPWLGDGGTRGMEHRGDMGLWESEMDMRAEFAGEYTFFVVLLAIPLAVSKDPMHVEAIVVDAVELTAVAYE